MFNDNINTLLLLSISDSLWASTFEEESSLLLSEVEDW